MFGASQGKMWETLSQEEQDTKLKAVGNLLVEHGLGHIKPKILDQVIYFVKQGATKRQRALMIDGAVTGDQAAAVKNFKKAAKEGLLAGINPQTANIDIEVKLAVGAPFVPISQITDIEKQEEQSIQHKQGQVLLIDFWATWCPPCQKPMAHNQEMLEHHGAAWGDKVRIIGISIDQTAEAVVKHVAAKGWKSVEHFHRAGSTCDNDYGVQGVPHVVLIDTHGKIAFVGHPASTDLEAGIEKLLKGQSLGGAGEDGDNDEGGAFKVLDVNAVLAEMDTFEKKLEDLKANPQLQNKQALERDFVVLIRQTQYDPVTQKLLTDYKNVNVLVGPSDAVTGAKAEVEKFITGFGGSFKSEWKVQAH